MSDPRDYKLDLSALAEDDAARRANCKDRPFISVHFACCGVYRRIYRSANGKSYFGNCPRCARPVRFKVGPGGIDARAFVVK
jgi:hypothetical protein